MRREHVLTAALIVAALVLGLFVSRDFLHAHPLEVIASYVGGICVGSAVTRLA